MGKFAPVKIGPKMLVALDISTAETGMAVAVDGMFEDIFATKPFVALKDYAKLLDLAESVVEWVSGCCDMSKIDQCNVVVEQPFFVPGKSHPGPMYMLHGMILQSMHVCCKHYGAEFSWNEVSVSTWRNWLLKAAGIKPASKKSEDLKDATKLALTKLGYGTYDNDNIADARSILVWAQHMMKEN